MAPHHLERCTVQQYPSVGPRLLGVAGSDDVDETGATCPLRSPRGFLLSVPCVVARRKNNPFSFHSASPFLPNPFPISMLTYLHIRRRIPNLLKPYTTTLQLPQTQPQPQPLTTHQLKSLVLSHYSHGIFTNLLQNVVALPSVLLTACHNLSASAPPLHSLSPRFSLDSMSQEIRENRLDVAASCVTLGGNGSPFGPLVLPNLKLKVLVEAVRMVLEVVYDERFVTFCYGGRVGMGRHTAIRYLKNSVENPSWWFTVRFNRHRFWDEHVERLCSVIERKVNDVILIGLIKRLFECRVLVIELGGDWIGRGFPQECGLCSVLMNVYFDGFDREIQEIRIRENQESRELDLKLAGSAGGVLYKPVKVYAVRYFDEILVVTSGKRMMAMELKNNVVRSLEADLGLDVDKVNTAIHSATEEKIEFVGMELQAVPPSVLRPPMTEKAIRARKKYLRQKEVRAIELRNARERNRRILGLKIFNHVYKKAKQSHGFKFDYSIENEVREIFKSWADEVVQEFLGNIDECQEWHRRLSAGDFLSLGHIRNQLPPELIDAYDNFQEQVDKYLNPVKARKAIEEEAERVREEEEERYAKGTLEDLTRLCIKVDAPIIQIRKAVKLVGFTNHMGRPRPIESLFALEDVDIIKWYAGIARRWLDFYCCCHNFKAVKTIVSYHLRFSCLLTLAEKHESTKREAIKHFSKDLKVYNLDGNDEVHFPTEREVKMMGDRNLSDPKPVDGALSLAAIRLASDEPPSRCIAHFCDNTTTVFYRVRLLQKCLNINPQDKEKWVQGMGAIHESLNQKCLPLCTDHIHDLYMGRITLQDVDFASFADVD